MLIKSGEIFCVIKLIRHIFHLVKVWVIEDMCLLECKLCIAQGGSISWWTLKMIITSIGSELSLFYLLFSMDNLSCKICQKSHTLALVYFFNHLAPSFLVEVEAFLHPVKCLLQQCDLLLRDVLLEAVVFHSDLQLGLLLFELSSYFLVQILAFIINWLLNALVSCFLPDTAIEALQ